MAESISVEKRPLLGKMNNRRLRRAGHIPAVLYGHGEASVSLALSAEALRSAMRHGARLFDLRGGVEESAIIQELKWDTYGVEVLHVDFIRVKADERIAIEVGVALKGEAPGAKEGGIVAQLVHEVKIETLPGEIPDRLHVNLSGLHVGGHLSAKDIYDLPASARLLSDPGLILVQCTVPVEQAEAAPAGETAEPELIGRKPDEAAEEEE